MKATKTIIALLALSAGLFSSCKKSSYNALTPDSATPTVTADQSRSAQTSGRVELALADGGIVTYNLALREGGRVMGEMPDLRFWSFTEPLLQAGMPLKSGRYNDLTTTLELRSMEGGAGLHLRGKMTMYDEVDQPIRSMPFDLVVAEHLQLQASAGAIEITDQTTMMQLLGLDMKRLAVGIPMEMWHGAISGSSNMLYISADQSPELYRHLLDNLFTMLRPVADGVQRASVSGDAVAAE